jgi:hypothetical protein
MKCDHCNKQSGNGNGYSLHWCFRCVKEKYESLCRANLLNRSIWKRSDVDHYPDNFFLSIESDLVSLWAAFPKRNKIQRLKCKANIK